jgi:glyoxylase-like metal-dependent hydrolase (beta-lactamase superfamily II)
MQSLAAGVSYFDLHFQQLPHIIAAGVIHGPGGAAIVDPGPSSSLPALRNTLAAAGIAMRDVTTLLLTHIHLDHAGGTGTLLRERPDLRVYVHRSGAPHLVDPSKLLASASRLYGDAMAQLWGDVLPVPAESLVLLDGGERIAVGGRTLEVAYTPGHASHHVSYFSPDTGIAFVGDTAGVRLVPHEFIMPPTPPPDIDLTAWGASLAIFDAWRPATLFLTHFGPSGPAGPHLATLREQIDVFAGMAKRVLEREGSDEDRERWFIDDVRRQMLRRLGEPAAAAYDTACRPDLNWRGLARYWRKRSA